MRKGFQIMTATPGRLLDHLRRHTLKLDQVQMVVLDEADEMLDMGFIDDIENILSQMPHKPQMLCFSATMPEPILKLASKFMKDYELVKVQTQDMTSSLTKQIFYEVYEEDKLEALRRTIDIAPEFYGLVFCRTKIQCDEIGNKLISLGYNAEALHGDLSQSQRELIVHRMREHRISILVATDVAARGIDIPELTHVVNFSLPEDPESYIHRVGRTGRAGKEGLAVSFVTPREFRKLAFFKKVAKTEIEKRRVPTVDDIIAAKKKTLLNELLAMIAEAESGNCPENMYSLAKLLGESHHTTNIIAALLSDKYGRMVDISGYGMIADLYDRTEKSERRRPERRLRPEFRIRRDGKAKGKKKANTSRFKSLGK
jgi:ATP-dependent RNA helicase DeaD